MDKYFRMDLGAVSNGAKIGGLVGLALGVVVAIGEVIAPEYKSIGLEDHIETAIGFGLIYALGGAGINLVNVVYDGVETLIQSPS